MNDENCELWQLGVRTGPKTTGDLKLRDGKWDELVERINLPSTPNGNFRIIALDRSVVFTKTGNHGDGKRTGTVVKTPDPTVVRLVEAPKASDWE